MVSWWKLRSGWSCSILIGVIQVLNSDTGSWKCREAMAVSIAGGY